MAYHGHPNYSSYYGGTQSDQPIQNGYGSARVGVPTSSYQDPVAYSTEVRQRPYSPLEYSWPTSNQQPYGSSHTAQGQAAGESYRDTANGQSYDYQRAHASYVGSNKEETKTRTSSNGITHAPNQPSTQALNELAYASGLESSGIQSTANSRTVQPSPRNDTPKNSSLSQPRPQAAARQQSYNNHSQPSPYGVPNNYQPNDRTQLALQAAAALHSLPNNSRTNAASPTISNASAASAHSQPRSKSPYTTSENPVLHGSSQPSHSRSNQWSSGADRVNMNKGATQSPSMIPQQSYGITPNEPRSAPGPQTNSVASSAARDEQQVNLAYLSPSQQPNATTFINPREVFNPYHREHERVRRETAAAEAAAQKRAGEYALDANKLPPAGKAAETHSTSAAFEPSTKSTKLKSSSNAGAKASDPAPALETAEEAELRQLMARMKQLRGKDAALFQRVWDEEKGGSAAKVPIAPPMAAPQAVLTYAQATSQARAAVQRPSPASASRDSDLPRGFNGYSVVVEDNEEGLPDLGKFPAARRVRYSYQSRRQQQSSASLPQHLPVPVPIATPTPAPAPVTQVMSQFGPLVFNPNVTSESEVKVQPLPAKNKDGTIMWPEAQRNVLAAQAIKFLKSDHRHESLSISPADFVEMLKGNPSYITLCELIEARGFTFDRAQFARGLVMNVPGLTTSKQASQPLQNTAPPQKQTRKQAPPVHAAVFQSSPAVFSLLPANHAPLFMMGDFIKPETPRPSLKAANPLLHRQTTPLVAHARSRLSVLAPKIAGPEAGSKEDMARKRGFDDLIDLTNEHDEDYFVPGKRLRIGSSSPDPIAAFVRQSQPQSEAPSSFIRFGSPTPQGVLPKAATPVQSETHVSSFIREELKQSRAPKVMLAKKINKAEALRRNYYDSKTIARDILISTGRHPTERPLNGHLAGLLGNHIELDSDLSTFHWEDVDPGGPPAPKTAWTDVPAGPPRFKSQKSESNKHKPTDSVQKPLQVSSEPPPGRAASDLTRGLASRGHVTPRTDYTGRLGSGKSMRVQEYQSPSSKKGQMPRSLAASTLKPRDLSPQAAQRTLALQVKPLVGDSYNAPQHRPSGLSESQVATSEAGLSQVIPPKKRGPGRPRRQSNPLNSSPLPQIGPPKRRGPARRPRSVASPQVQVSPSRPAESIPSLQRSTSIEIPKMAGHFRTTEKRKGQQPGSTNNLPPGDGNGGAMSVEVVIPRLRSVDESPEYPIFRCRWSGCKAELHNISTLRKHIIKLHRPAQEIADVAGYGCYWKKCSLLRKDEEGNFEPTPIDTEENWLAHINEEHIYPLGQKHGDGPSTTHIGKLSQPFEATVSKYFYNPSLSPTDARIVSYTDPQAVASDRNVYLADENGRTTTHLAHFDDEPDAVILTDFYTNDVEANKAAEVAFKNFLGNHGHIKQDMRAAADETFKAMVVRKEKIGVGIDRGGCTLVNDERRKTFVQNPGISRVVDYDY